VRAGSRWMLLGYPGSTGPPVSPLESKWPEHKIENAEHLDMKDEEFNLLTTSSTLEMVNRSWSPDSAVPRPSEVFSKSPAWPDSLFGPALRNAVFFDGSSDNRRSEQPMETFQHLVAFEVRIRESFMTHGCWRVDAFSSAWAIDLPCSNPFRPMR
jgi:hypothetical protein